MSTSNLKLYNYQDHDKIPADLWQYMTSVADIDNSLDEVSINDINDFLNFVETEGQMGLPDEVLMVPTSDPRQLELDFCK
tara:strand:+ start:176 stop:415 length:240 start_codon:yes stop_codon:yes gene_type:complete